MKRLLSALALCAFTALANAGPDQTAPPTTDMHGTDAQHMGTMHGMQGMESPQQMRSNPHAASARHGGQVDTSANSATTFKEDLAACKQMDATESRDCRREAYAAKAEGLYRR